MEQTIIHYTILFFIFLVALLIQASLIRLLGCLIGALISAYELIYIKYFDYVLIKKNGKLHLRKLFLSNPAIQCSMFAQAEEDKKQEKKHLYLYFMGGSIANVVTGVLFLVLAFLLKNQLNYYVHLFLFDFALIGIVYGLFNLIPLQFKQIFSEAKKAMKIIDNEQARHDYFDFIYVLKHLTDDVNLIDIDKKRLQIDRPLVEVGPSNLVFRREYHLHNNEIEKSAEITQYILANQDKIPPMDVNSVKMDTLITKMKAEIISDKTTILDRQLMAYLKLTQKLPPTIIFNYAVALLIDKNKQQANNQLELLEKIRKSYPFNQKFEYSYTKIEEINQVVENRKNNDAA